MKLIFLLSLISTTYTYAIYEFDYRSELKEMTLKNHRPLKSYKQSRKHIFQRIHLKQDSQGYYVKDVYCHKIIRTRIGPGKMPSPDIINIEHTWPQSKFNGRENHNIQKADLHILYPTDSKANSSRGSFRFYNLPGGKDATRSCAKSKKDYVGAYKTYAFEPPLDQKGNVARAIFYFSIRYTSHIQDLEEEVLREWNKLDPPDEDELRRNDIIEKIQGNRNPFIDDPEYADFIDNF